MAPFTPSAIHNARRHCGELETCLVLPQHAPAIIVTPKARATTHMEVVATTGSRTFFMKIGELARAAGTSSETIRYYERIDLVRRPERTDGNYRDYGPGDVERLAFIRHARGLGFEISDIRSLLALAEQPERDCGTIDEIASRHLATVETKIVQLDRLRDDLRTMISQCGGGRVSSCRILQALGDHAGCGSAHAGA